MSVDGERQISLNVESYEVVRDAMNTREIDDVDFASVSEVIPKSMSPDEVDAFRKQYVEELFVRNPNWDGSVRRLNSRLVFTIGQAACFEGQDVVTAKSAQKVLLRQKRLLSWGFANMLKKILEGHFLLGFNLRFEPLTVSAMISS